MIIFHKATPLQVHISSKQTDGESVGFVPTMGALHEGHLSLIEEAKKMNDLVVCSIFINPSQFNNKEDLVKYPVTLERDIELLEVSGCDVLFLPSEKEIYPPEYVAKYYNLGTLENILEGKHRPGHFQGVCQVVDRLLEIVNPTALFLGQKDYQQCLVIKKLLELTGSKTTTHIVPTKRESSGLAMSSRNLRLNKAQKSKAALIYEMLNHISDHILTTNPAELTRSTEEKLVQSGFNVDYVSIAHGENLHPLGERDTNMVALIAATIDNVRLIDNKVLGEPS